MRIFVFPLPPKADSLLTYELIYFDKGTLWFKNEQMVDCPCTKT